MPLWCCLLRQLSSPSMAARTHFLFAADSYKGAVMKFKVILLGAALLGAGSIASAQSTPYSTPQLSVTFNGPVTVEVDRNKEDTSTDTEYSSSRGAIYQMLSVRTVTAKDLDVQQDTLDSYVEQALDDAKPLDRRNQTYQEHIGEYVSFNKSDFQWRMWFIIVNPRTVLILSELAPVAANDDAAWSTFSDSLVIKAGKDQETHTPRPGLCRKALWYCQKAARA
jgi:hypothetical protein